MHRLYAERGIGIDVEIPPDLTVRVQREDLDEMIGNLLDNACKWGRSHVRISGQQAGSLVEITVEDDGSGLVAHMREVVLQRGVRADEAAPGSGLGLAIVRDIAEVYGGSIALEASPPGGVRARLRFPS
jgi:signal transduction histidine kinase